MSYSQKKLPANLSLPHTSRYLVESPNLASWLEECAEASLVLAVASPGFGKTTAILALHERLREAGVNTSWIQLNPDDNHLERFCSLVSATLVPAPGSSQAKDKSNSNLYDAPHASAAIGFKLVETVSQLWQPTTIFLDDFENITDPLILLTVQRMIECLPKQCRLVIASRSQPNLKLLKLKAQGKVLQIGTQELSFDFDQARTFFNLRHHLGLDDVSIRRMYDRAEGWPTGLQLAALALTSSKSKLEFIENFCGNAADIGTYMYEEVLSTQPEAVQSFLEKTSILTRLSTTLCDAVADINDSAIVLRRLEQQNLFLVRIGESGEQYRYHPLFAEYLQKRLREERPELLPVLHGKAASWHLANGHLAAAIDHAQAAGDYEKACTILEGHIWSAIYAGSLSVCHMWLSSIPPAVMENHPKLQVAKCWTHVFQHEYVLANDLASRLRHHPALQDYSDFQILEPMTLAFMDQVVECENMLAARVTDTAITGAAKGILHNILTFMHLCGERFAKVPYEADMAKAVFRQYNSVYGPVYTQGFEVHAMLAQGQLDQVVGFLEPVFAEAIQRSGRYSTGCAHLAIYLAEALYEKGDCERAMALVEEYIDTTRMIGVVDTIVVSHRLLSRGYCLTGQYQRAKEIVEQGINLGRNFGLQRIAASMRLELQYQLIHQHEHSSNVALQLVAIEDPVWTYFDGRMAPGNDAENYQVTCYRVWIRNGECRRVLSEAPTQILAATKCGRIRLALKLRILLVLAMDANGQKEALNELIDILQMKNGQGFVSTFLEEGPRAIKLLAMLKPVGGDTNLQLRIQYILAKSASATVSSVVPIATVKQAEPDALSEREMEILSCLSAGLPNKAIATKLYISEPTVKFHLRNINGKLGTKNRTHAVFMGRQLGWITS